MIIFDGNEFAAIKEQQIKSKLQNPKFKNQRLKIAAILFREDAGSRLYSGLKKEAAERVGITYELYEFSLNSSVTSITQLLDQLNKDKSVTGIIIQKPAKSTYSSSLILNSQPFSDWWQTLTSAISPAKDVDGLHPETLAAIKRGTWQTEGKVMPATAKAILEILKNFENSNYQNPNSKQISNFKVQSSKFLILNRSAILGQPLYYELKNRGVDVTLWGSKDLQASFLNSQSLILNFDVIITATGKKHLITGDMVKDGVILIDAPE